MRIWYSVHGHGLGHAVRSEPIIASLQKKHEVFITAANKAFSYLSMRFPKVEQLSGHDFVYRKNTLCPVETLLLALARQPRNWQRNRKALAAVRAFAPQLLITDFEPVSARVARRLGIPILGIDNIRELSACNINIPQGAAAEYQRASWFIKKFAPAVDQQLIPSFSGAQPIDRKTTSMLSPIVREAVEHCKERQGAHVVVYQTSVTNTEMLDVLRLHPRKFGIYGMGRDAKEGNLQFQSEITTDFLQDLASAAYVIVNGGFTTISEALFLHKPVLAIPIHGQGEQSYNGHCLERLKYGATTTRLTAEDLRAFEANLAKMRAALRQRPSWSQKKVHAKIERTVLQLSLRNIANKPVIV